MTFLMSFILWGSLAALIPIIVHLLRRQKTTPIAWGAMQFLQISERTRRKVFLEEVLLMLIRMGLIALMVIALAAPLVSASAHWPQ